ncbi:hypothetical protein B5F37_11625 [Drancourtella sp. An210]|nr:hypothetical protein B5F37_11625 [Drancourtella sp. An210]
MERKEQILQYVKKAGKDIEVMEKAIDEMLFLEEQMEDLKKLPFIQVHPSNPARQKSTPAAKLYKEFLQQYTNIVKMIEKTAGEDGDDEESPLRIWLKETKNIDFGQ